MRRSAVLLLMLILLAACGQGENVMGVTLDKDRSDTATVTVEKGRATIDVTSASGIGGLTATADDWPEQIVVRLHTRGLEQLEIAYGNVTIATGVASDGGPGPALMLSVTDDEGRVQSASPSSYVYYPDIRISAGAGETAAIPLPASGAFEITLPPHFHQGDYDSFHMTWIDFYR